MSEHSLAVRFYEREIKNEFMSDASGRPIHQMADFVRIEVPGNLLSIIDTLANNDHRQRFPIQWAQFCNDKAAGNTTGDFQGTLLTSWPLLTAAQCAELKHFKFYTVEQIASAGDALILNIGMLAGMSPFSLRDKAKTFLAVAAGSADAMAAVDAVKARDAELADLKSQLIEQRELVQRLVEASAKQITSDEVKRAEPAKKSHHKKVVA